MANRLVSAPLRLNTKAGDKKDPINKLEINTLNKLTCMAVVSPKLNRQTSTITLDSPGFNPGKMLGIELSTIWMAIANAVNEAISRSFLEGYRVIFKTDE